MKAPKGPVRIDIGIPEEKREKIAQGLSNLLADSFTLYLMTHNFHWNVTGPMFNTLHQMFMQQYTEQWTALDEIASASGRWAFPPPGRLRNMSTSR
jgi:starvation-inducible DNA-binding protein